LNGVRLVRAPFRVYSALSAFSAAIKSLLCNAADRDPIGQHFTFARESVLLAAKASPVK
jgi:hypothetical protein